MSVKRNVTVPDGSVIEDPPRDPNLMRDDRGSLAHHDGAGNHPPGSKKLSMRSGAMRRCRLMLVLGALLLSTASIPARADESYLKVCGIAAIDINHTCHADLVAINTRAGEWLNWMGGPFITLFAGTYKWRLTWGEDPSNNWAQLTCAGVAATADCVFLVSPLRAPIKVGDEMTFDADGNAAWGDAGTLLYGVAFREPSQRQDRRYTWWPSSPLPIMSGARNAIVIASTESGSVPVSSRQRRSRYASE